MHPPHADDRPYIVFSTEASAAFADDLARRGGFARGEIERKTFPDGEQYHRIASPVYGERVALVGAASDDASTLELFDLGCGLARQGCRSLTLVLPYFGYSTMERAARMGEVVKAKTRALLFSAIPHGAEQNAVLLFDLHAPGIPHYFEGGVRVAHLYGRPVVLQAIRDLGGADLVVAAPDAGRAKWAASLAADLRAPAAFAYKTRAADGALSFAGLNAEVKERSVVIYDDMIRSGGTLLQAAEAFRAAGAGRVSAVLTHWVAPPGAADRLLGTGLIDALACTDTHPGSAQAGSQVTVYRAAGVFANYLNGELRW